jgi:hypothetical protein
MTGPVRGVLFDAAALLDGPDAGGDLDRVLTEAQRTRPADVTDPAAAMLRAAVEPPVVRVFPDVHPVLSVLAGRGTTMAVVSGTWTGLEPGFRALRLGHFFAGYLTPGELGAAADLLGWPAAACLLVGVAPSKAAAGLGYRTVVLSRHTAPRPAILSLYDLVPLVTGR